METRRWASFPCTTSPTNSPPSPPAGSSPSGWPGGPICRRSCSCSRVDSRSARSPAGSIRPANSRIASLTEMRRFKETITILLVSGLFLLLAAALDMQAVRSLDLRAVAFVALVLFVIRPLVVLISTAGSGVTLAKQLFVGWIAPGHRGGGRLEPVRCRPGRQRRRGRAPDGRRHLRGGGRHGLRGQGPVPVCLRRWACMGGHP
jgi:hypothetical protein